VPAADLDRLAERLTEAGSPVQWDDAIPGTRRFYTADPWGNRIELVAAAER
jgi:predicted enzyme related to lactoylglutathione lyase